jgi:hypothetical protein
MIREAGAPGLHEAGVDAIASGRFDKKTATRTAMLNPSPSRIVRPYLRRLRAHARAPWLLGRERFTNHIASGGGRDFMRAISQEMYGIPRERVIGSSAALASTSDDRGGTITHTSEPEYLDDGAQKPIRIWRRTGRRPLLAAGNSNGDVPMLEFTHHGDKPSLRLLVLHDDAGREFDYTTGAEHALERPEALDGRSSASRAIGTPSSDPAQPGRVLRRT